LCFFRLQDHAEWKVGANVLEEQTTSTFRVEDQAAMVCISGKEARKWGCEQDNRRWKPLKGWE
jgi:hypothetical protein